MWHNPIHAKNQEYKYAGMKKQSLLFFSQNHALYHQLIFEKKLNVYASWSTIN